MIGHQVQASSLHCRRPTPALGLALAQGAASCRRTPPPQRSPQGQAPSLNFQALSCLVADLLLAVQEHIGAHRESKPHSLSLSSHRLDWPPIRVETYPNHRHRCDTEFKRKFDWKRHEDEFHERYKKYPCPDCNRVFWGANTFNQHHKTRHNCKTCPHADKVIKYTRKKRAWACGFCAAFLPSMDRYIDHIGLHYESGRTKAHWYHSNVIYGLLHQPGINAEWKNIIGSRLSHIPKDQQPRYGWDPKTTGRKQGFLENETAGNLQDLLEFFNPTKDDPAQVAQLAFDFAERTPPNQVPSNFEGPRKAPLPPPPAPKREKSSSSSRRKPSGPQKELAPTPVVKERPITQWPGYQTQDVPELPSSKALPSNNDGDVQMPDYDTTAVPPPLFANSMSPPPPQYVHHQHHQPPPGIAISPSSDQPTFLTPTTPLSQPPPTPFPGMQSRDTVVDLLSDYMSQDQMHGVDDPNMPDMPDMHHHMSTPLCQNPPFHSYDDWNSLCSTMIDDVNAPRQNGPPLPAAPHEMEHQQHHHQQQQERSVRRSDFWTPGGEGPESMYVDGVQACDLASMPPHPGPPSLHESTHHHHQHDGRSRNVWAASVDYEGMGYEDEIAPPPPASNWL